MGFLLKKLADTVKFVVALAYCVCLYFVRNRARRVVIFYHGISRTDVSGFTRQMAYLARECSVVKPSMIREARADGTKVLVAVTFDDAFVSVRENALPVLREYGLPTGVFVPTGCLGRKPGWAMTDDCRARDDVVMSKQEIAELSHEGIEVLSHTVSHAILTETDDGRLEKELAESRKELQKITGHEILAVSYPHGAHDARVCNAAKRAGYKLGFTVEPEMVECSSDDMRLGRFAVSPRDSLTKFRLKVNGSYQAEKYLRRLKALLVALLSRFSK